MTPRWERFFYTCNNYRGIVTPILIHLLNPIRLIPEGWWFRQLFRHLHPSRHRNPVRKFTDLAIPLGTPLTKIHSNYFPKNKQKNKRMNTFEVRRTDPETPKGIAFKKEIKEFAVNFRTTPAIMRYNEKRAKKGKNK